MPAIARPPQPDAGVRRVAAWLILCAAMVFVMVVLGGVTRLTESGLSMVDWRPLMGILPPLGEAEWMRIFDRYKASPEFQRMNFWMTLADFKTIFWAEYIHRVWGRLVGIVFLLPFLYFLIRGRIGRRLGLHLAVIFALGAAQGLMGWYMVMSGLVDQPEVSQYRLAAHLALAFAIYGYMIWVAMGLLAPEPAGGAEGARLKGHAWTVLVWAAVTVVTGAFVAGLDAGLAYNTFPLMDGRLVPAGILDREPWVMNLFENTATVQFEHRTLAMALVAMVLWLWWRAATIPLEGRARHAVDALAAMVLVQLGLGIATLLTAVQIALATLHQAGAMALFTLALWTVFELRDGARSAA